MRGKKTTAEQLRKMLSLFREERYPDAQIAEISGVHVRVVRYYKRIYGYTGHGHRHGVKWDARAAEEACQIWRKTHNIEALTQHFGVHENTLRTQFSKLRGQGIYAPYLYK